MPRKVFLVTVFLVLLVTVGCRNAEAAGILPEEGSISGVLVNGGAVHAAVTLSLPVATVHNCDLVLDLMGLQGGFGGGVSTPVAQVLGELGIMPNIPLLGDVVNRFRAGLCLMKAGTNWDGGAYLMLPLATARF